MTAQRILCAVFFLEGDVKEAFSYKFTADSVIQFYERSRNMYIILNIEGRLRYRGNTKRTNIVYDLKLYLPL